MMNESYDSARSAAHSTVVGVLKSFGLDKALRGSWAFGDFHLSADHRTSYSDLDLTVPGIGDSERISLVDAVSVSLSSHMNIPVSIHPQDHLLKMSLADSWIMNIGEYLSKREAFSSSKFHSYMLAKISLLLSRESTVERYSDVAYRLGSDESRRSLLVKLGRLTDFSIEDAVSLMRTSTCPAILFFVGDCLQKRDFGRTVDFVVQRLVECRSIDPWLRNRLIEKMSC